MFILSLFPGADLLSLPFEQLGWCVVQARDKQFGGDHKQFHPPPDRFDGVIGGPPCQKWSKLQSIVRLNRERELAKDPASTKYAEAEDLIPEFVRIVTEAQPTWFLMENTPDVPKACWPRPTGYHVSSFVLNNRWVTETTPQNRVRRFWFGHQECCIDLRKYLDVALFEPAAWEYAVLASGSRGGHPVPVRLNSGGKPKRLPKSATSRSIEDYLRLQGLPENWFDGSPFTLEGKKRLIGNGVPLSLGRAVAKAIQRALELDRTDET